MKSKHAIHFIYFHLSVTVAFVAGYYFTFVMFMNYASDTTTISNAAFALAASIAGLSFSCAGAIEGSQEIKDRYTYAGERCFHAAVLLLVASVLKYTLLALQKQEIVLGQRWLLQGSRLVLGGMAGALFFLALLSTHTGIRVVNDLLCSRITRHKDWDHWV